MSFPLRPHVRSCIVFALASMMLAGQSVAKSLPSRPAKLSASDVERGEAAESLAVEVREIAGSHAISRAKKEKRISTAVRVAVVAATAYKKDPDDALGTALELTRAAAAAAPSFAEIISNAVAFAPSLSRIDSASGRIRAAAFAAAKAPGNVRRTTTASAKTKRPPAPVALEEEEAPAPMETSSGEAPVRRQKAPRVAADEPRDYPAPAEESSSQGKIITDRNSGFTLSTDLSVRHDDNVYLSDAFKTGDTIIAVTPGVEFHFGQNSLAHGSISYRDAFTRYTDKTAPNVSLSSGAAEFGYNTGATSIIGDASFQQTNQNNPDVAALGEKAIFRQDVFGASASVESQVAAKTSIKTGVNYSKSEYKTANLIGSQDTEVPIRIYYETTPKVSLSTGFGYRRVNPQNGGDSGRDLDYNVGARGAFTPKLNGEFSIDYRTRSVGTAPRENLWGFNGGLSYEITPKTSSSLVFSRDFNTGALGETLKNSNYTLKVTSDLTPQWQVGSGISFRKVEYGPTVFSTKKPITLIDRTDTYWEGNVQVSYLFSSWFTASADYTFRHNESNLIGAQFSNSIISLILGWHY